MNKTCVKCGESVKGNEKLWLNKFCGRCYVNFLRSKVPSANWKKVARRLGLAGD